jgi:hypothetical protein
VPKSALNPPPCHPRAGEWFDIQTAHPFLRHCLRLPTSLPPHFPRWDVPASGVALVPGCGRGYDVAAIATAPAGAAPPTVVGVEYAATAAAVAGAFVAEQLAAAEGSGGAPPAGKAEVRHGDFFALRAGDFPGPITLIYDYTFLCALPPDRRREWAEQVRTPAAWACVHPLPAVCVNSVASERMSSCPQPHGEFGWFALCRHEVPRGAK